MKELGIEIVKILKQLSLSLFNEIRDFMRWIISN